MTMTAKAYAKINLTLDVVGRRDDGYHLLKTVMQSVSLHDNISITSTDDCDITVHTSNSNIADDKSNLAYKAAAAFFEAAGIATQGISIDIQKNIPIQAGLAGGSADAAGVLYLLNRMFGTDMSHEKLCFIGEKLGADVPFCLTGGTVLCEGIGEKLTPLPNIPECFILIAKPDGGVSTAEAYRAVDSLPDAEYPHHTKFIESIHRGDIKTASSLLYNKFEEALRLPSNAIIRKAASDCGALGACMTGSGSSVFAIFDDESLAKRCLDTLKDDMSGVFITAPTKCAVE